MSLGPMLFDPQANVVKTRAAARRESSITRWMKQYT